MTDPILPHTQPDPHGDGTVISDERAKSGRGGMHVMTIMIVSAVLVAIAFAIIWFVWSPSLNQAQETTEAAATSIESAQPTTDRPTPTLPTEAQPRTPDPATSATGKPAA